MRHFLSVALAALFFLPGCPRGDSRGDDDDATADDDDATADDDDATADDDDATADDDDATADDDDVTADDDDATADDDDATADDDDATVDDDDAADDDDSGSADDDDVTADDDDSASSEGLPIGDPCVEDVDCATGVCWDFNDYDPWCFGAFCSDECVTTPDCVAIFTAAGAPSPSAATCGFDGRCDPVGTGFGAFACALWRPPER